MMTEEELRQQENWVNEVIDEAEMDVLEEWIAITEEDYWYNLSQGYLKSLIGCLQAKGVNTDSITVMSYVDECLGELGDLAEGMR